MLHALVRKSFIVSCMGDTLITFMGDFFLQRINLNDLEIMYGEESLLLMTEQRKFIWKNIEINNQESKYKTVLWNFDLYSAIILCMSFTCREYHKVKMCRPQWVWFGTWTSVCFNTPGDDSKEQTESRRASAKGGH